MTVAIGLLVVTGLAAFATLLFFDPDEHSASEDHQLQQSQKMLQPVSPSVRDGNRPMNSVAFSNGAQSPLTFTNVAQQCGMEFEYYGAPTPEHFMTEQNGGGVAVLDFDADGHGDVFFSNGSDFRVSAAASGAVSELFRAADVWSYSRVAVFAGVAVSGFGQGCAAGDFDNDGFADLAMAAYGRNRLWQNNGDGTFSEINEPAYPQADAWSTSLAFADLDADGLLDLYVVNYVNWTADAAPCFLDSERRMRKVCSPLDFDGQSDVVLRNSGDGRFEVAGTFDGQAIATDGKGLALQVADFDDDGRLDVFVANDTTRNFLFLNQGALAFRESAVAKGLGMSQDGTLGSSMGIATGDYDRDGRLDLFVTNFAHEVVDALTNLGDAGFVASNAELGLDRSSRAMLNFGIVVDDFDLDGWPDLFFANGHIWDSGPGGDEYEMRPTLMKNISGKRFADVSNSAGDYFQKRWLGRAAARGDLDNDGDVDLVVAHLAAPSAVLRNDSRREGSSLRFRFIGTTTARDALGCRVEIAFADHSSYVSNVPSGGSFQASHSPEIIVPVRDGVEVTAATIRWPNGVSETWHAVRRAGVERSGTLVLLEGTGAVH